MKKIYSVIIKEGFQKILENQCKNKLPKIGKSYVNKKNLNDRITVDEVVDFHDHGIAVRFNGKESFINFAPCPLPNAKGRSYCNFWSVYKKTKI